MRLLQTGIKIKMTLAFSGVFTVLALTFNTDSYRHIKAMLLYDNDRYLEARATSLLEKTEVNPAIISLPDKGSYIRVFYHSYGQYHLVFESPGLPSGIRTPTHTGVSDSLGMRIAYVRNTGTNAEDNPAELLLVTSTSSLNERIHSLAIRLIVSTLMSVLIAACVSFLLAEFLLQPLQRIIDTARTINTRRLRDLIPVRNTRDELQTLTETLNQMLTRIANALQQQESFFASASHELKTPLAVMRAELEFKLHQPGIDDDIRQLLVSQLSEIKRLQDRIDEFLVVSQLKEGRLTLRIQSFDISTIVIRTFNTLMRFLTAKSLKPDILFDPEADGFFIDADEDKISIVLLNLLENAIKYAVAGTTIYCRIHKPQEKATIIIEIENTIAEESVETSGLKNAFYRNDNMASGTGLGLWLSSEIAQLHNGSLSLSSANYTFIAELEIPAHLNQYSKDKHIDF